MKHLTLPASCFLLLLFAAACGGSETPSPENTEVTTTETDTTAVQVFFVTPADGDTVTSPVRVVMGTEGVRIVPAGTMEEGTGHLHILIDTDFVPAGQVIPTDSLHLHFGQGQLETELELAPGTHTLRLQLADGAHIALDGPQYRDEIQITVQQ